MARRAGRCWWENFRGMKSRQRQDGPGAACRPGLSRIGFRGFIEAHAKTWDRFCFLKGTRAEVKSVDLRSISIAKQEILEIFQISCALP